MCCTIDARRRAAPQCNASGAKERLTYLAKRSACHAPLCRRVQRITVTLDLTLRTLLTLLYTLRPKVRSKSGVPVGVCGGERLIIGGDRCADCRCDTVVHLPMAACTERVAVAGQSRPGDVRCPVMNSSIGAGGTRRRPAVPSRDPAEPPRSLAVRLGVGHVAGMG